MTLNPPMITMLVGVASLIVSIIVIIRNGNKDDAESAREMGELRSDIKHILEDIKTMSAKLDRIEEDRAEHDQQVRAKIMDLDRRVTTLEADKDH